MSLAGQCYYRTCRTRPGRGVARATVATLRRLGMFRAFKLPLDALALPHVATRSLMTLWSRIHWMGGDGMMPPEQMLALYRLAVSWPGDGDIVELGAWTGLTTCYLAAAAKARGGGHVYAVDTFVGTKEGSESYAAVARYGGSTWATFRKRVRTAGLADRVTALVGDTVEQAAAYPGRPIRFLLIDADHSYEGVCRDYHAWLPHVAPGGLIVFHDYAMPEAGVRRFVDEIVERQGSCEATPGRVHENVFAVARRLPEDSFPPHDAGTREEAHDAILC